MTETSAAPGTEPKTTLLPAYLAVPDILVHRFAASFSPIMPDTRIPDFASEDYKRLTLVARDCEVDLVHHRARMSFYETVDAESARLLRRIQKERALFSVTVFTPRGDKLFTATGLARLAEWKLPLTTVVEKDNYPASVVHEVEFDLYADFELSLGK